MGYNVFEGNPYALSGEMDPGIRDGKSVLLIEYDTGNPKYLPGHEKILKPRGTIPNPSVGSCDMKVMSTEITGVKSFQDDWDKSVSIDVAHFGARAGASVEWSDIVSATNSKSHVMYSDRVECSVYTAQFDMDGAEKPRISPSFINAVKNLPTIAMSKADKLAYSEFLDEWGTHVMTNIVLGGRYSKLYKADAKTYSELLGIGWKIKGSLGFDAVGKI